MPTQQWLDARTHQIAIIMLLGTEESKQELINKFAVEIEQDVYKFLYHSEGCGCPEANVHNIFVFEVVDDDSGLED